MGGVGRIAQILAISAFLLEAISGCGHRPYAQYPVTVKTPKNQALINVEDQALAQSERTRVSHLDAFEHVEYVRYETNDRILELVYDTALGDGLVLDYPYWMARMADTWNLNRDQAKVWGPWGTAQAWHGKIDYRLYQLPDVGRDCAAFNSEWDYDPRDPFGRPTRVLFGYLCASPGKPLRQPEVAALLEGVTVSQRLGESFVHAGVRARTDQIAFSAARGSAGSKTGNAEFPFNFGTPYFEGDDMDDYSG